MKVQEYILLIFGSFSFWAEPIIAEDVTRRYYESFEWPTDIPDISESTPTGYDYDKSLSEDNKSNEDSCDIYKYTAKKPDGQIVCLDQYAGKVLIIVNYASGCGFTNTNICNLSKIADKYGKQGLEILIFPSNDFSQNIGGDMAAAALANIHPEFEVFSEICVNGITQHPMYRFLKNKLPDPFNSKSIKWNFTKFVVGRNGRPVQRFEVTDSFEDIEELVQDLLEDQAC